MESPFIYGKTVIDKAFADRERESKKLFDNLTQGINTMIISPRRIGKTSLVEKVIKDILGKEKNIIVVSLDLYTVRTPKHFLELFAKELIRSSSNRWEDWMAAGKEFFSRLIPKISIGNDPMIDFSISFDMESLPMHEDEILNLPQKIAEKKSQQLIVCLDEFQSIASFKDYEGLEKAMRSYWQRHENVAYCLYGSKCHMMLEIFNNPSKPFYRFGDMIMLDRIDIDSWIDHITGAFRQSGKEITNAHAQSIAALMKCHPWYVQQLAHYTWQNTDRVVSKEGIDNAFSEVLRANLAFYQREIDGLSRTQINLLIAILNGEKKLTAQRVMQHYNLGTPNNVSKNKEKLKELDIIDESDNELIFLDPAFERWFETTFVYSPQY